MAVVGSAQLMARDIEATFEAGKFSVRVPYRIITNDRNDGPLTVCSASGLPAFGDLYAFGNESDDEMRLRSYQPQRIGDAATLVWVVWCQYSTPEQKDYGRGGEHTGGLGGGTGRESAAEFTNPLLETPSVKFHSSGREVPIFQIRDNITGTFKPATASNGEPFDPPPKTTSRVLTLEIVRNEPLSANQPAIAIQYQDAVNSDTFWGMPRGTWKVKEIVPERQERQIQGGTRVPFLRVAYSFEGRPEGWDVNLLDYGSFYLQNDPKGSAFPQKKTQFRTSEGHPTSGPLNGKGGALPGRMQFTVDTSTDIVTVPSNPAGITFSNGDLVLVEAASGSTLPTPLSRRRSYYVSGSSGLAFTLSGTVAGEIESIDFTVSPNQVTTKTPHGLTTGNTVVIADAQCIEFSDTDSVINTYWTIIVTGTRTFTLNGSVVAPLAYERGGKVMRPIDITTAGTGTFYIWSPGVFFRIRPQNWLPFAALGLPGSFTQVQ